MSAADLLNAPGAAREPGRIGFWVGASALAVAAHAGAVAWALRQPPVAPAMAAAPPAVMIDLAPEPVAPPTEEDMIEPDQVDVAEVLPPETEQITEMLEPVDVPPPPDLAEIVPPAVEPPPAVIPPPPPEVVAEAVIPRPVARPRNLAEVAPPPPTPEIKPKEPEPKKEPPREARRQAKVQAPTEAPKVAAAANSQAAKGSQSPAKWQSRLMAHLERRKKYPAAARSRRAEGVAMVRFAIDEQGNVLSVSLARSSGHADLDEAVIALVRRASPVPAPPPGAPREITAPVQFNIR